MPNAGGPISGRQILDTDAKDSSANDSDAAEAQRNGSRQQGEGLQRSWFSSIDGTNGKRAGYFSGAPRTTWLSG